MLCSTEYIDHIEKHVFGANVSNYYLSHYGDAQYGQGIKKTLETMASQIEMDFGRMNDFEEEYLSKKHKDKMFEMIKSLEKCGIRTSLSITDKLNKMYTYIEYSGESDIKAAIRKYSSKLLKPSCGVAGYGINLEGGIGWYGSIQSLFVIDSIGNYGIAGILGVGGGFGAGLTGQTFHFQNLSDIFSLDREGVFDLGASSNVSFGSASIGGQFYGGDADVGIGYSNDLDRWINGIDKISKALRVTANSQVHYIKLLCYKKVEKQVCLW